MPGTGYVANPAAISAYGSVVAQQAGPLTRINAALDGVRLPADAFGKLPEAGDLHAAYTSHASDIGEITAKLPEQIGRVAEGLSSTAKSYDDLEHGMASDIQTMFGAQGGGPGTRGGSSGTFDGIVADTAGAYRWVSEQETPMPALATGLIGDSGGLSGLIDEAINWVIDHVPELMKLLDDVTGDTAALQSAAQVWHEQGTALNSVLRDLRESAVRLPDEWAGEASSAFGGFMGDVTQALGMVATSMGQTQQILEDAAREAAFAHNTIVLIVREVVEWVALNIIADAATLGLATAVEAPATAAFLATRVEEAAQAAGRLASVYRGLLKIVEALQRTKQEFEAAEGLGRLTKFLGMGNRLNTLLKVGKLKNMRPVGLHGPNGEILRQASDLGASGVATVWAARTGLGKLADGVGLSGLATDVGESPVKSPIEGAAKEAATGHPEQAENTLQGPAEVIGVEPAIPPDPPVGRIERMLNDTKSPEEKPS